MWLMSNASQCADIRRQSQFTQEYDAKSVCHCDRNSETSDTTTGYFMTRSRNQCKHFLKRADTFCLYHPKKRTHFISTGSTKSRTADKEIEMSYLKIKNRTYDLNELKWRHSSSTFTKNTLNVFDNNSFFMVALCWHISMRNNNRPSYYYSNVGKIKLWEVCKTKPRCQSKKLKALMYCFYVGMFQSITTLIHNSSTHEGTFSKFHFECVKWICWLEKLSNCFHYYQPKAFTQNAS